MENDDIDMQAKALWDACQTTKPSWDQLGDVTKGEWHKKVRAGLTPADYLAPSPESRPVEHVPSYTVTEMDAPAGCARAVEIEVSDTEPAFVDETEPLVLSATHGGLPALESYLAALPVGDAWLKRESRGTADIASIPINGNGEIATLCIATSGKRATSEWYVLYVGEADSSVEMSVRHEQLGRSLLASLANGSLTARAATVTAAPTIDSASRRRPGV